MPDRWSFAPDGTPTCITSRGAIRDDEQHVVDQRIDVVRGERTSSEKITCPTLVYAGADDGFFTGQPELLYEHLTCPKALLEFATDQGAGAHCQAGAQRLAYAHVYDWLDDAM